MIEVSMVPPAYVDTCWDKVEPFAEKAAEYTYGRYTTNNIYERAKDESYQMWVAYDGDIFKGVVITEVVTYPQRKLLSMHFCGGIQLKEWKSPMLKLLQLFARDMGCDGIESVGRPGWEKVFREDGYKALWVTYELPIGE
jgi:hypothetical protein